MATLAVTASREVFFKADENLENKPLLEAIKNQNFQLAKELSSNESILGEKDSLDNSVLHYNAYFNVSDQDSAFQIISRVLSFKNSLLDEKNRNGATALYLCFDQLNLPIANFLIKSGADLETRYTKKKFTLLHCLANNTSPTFESDQAVEKFVHMLANSVPDCFFKNLINSKGNSKGDNRIQSTPSLLALESGNFPVFQFLVKMGADLAMLDDGKSNVFHSLAKGVFMPEQIELCHKMIQSSDRINIHEYLNSHEGINHSTPLHLTIKHQNVAAFSFFIINGADITALDYEKNSVLHLLAKYWKDVQVAQKFFNIITKAWPSFDLESKNKEMNTPLFCAVGERYPEAAKFFLAHGSDITARGEKNYTILHSIAFYSSNAQMAAQYLEAAKALLPENVINLVDKHAFDKNGNTPLNLAILTRRFNVIKFFIEEIGCDINFTD